MGKALPAESTLTPLLKLMESFYAILEGKGSVIRRWEF